jgi:hypothetical protein
VDLQLKNFILEPAKRLETVGPIFFVIDAVDESGDRTARTSLLKALLANLTKLPSNFRILVTSRPDNDIEQQLGSNSLVLRKSMEKVEWTGRDIRRYIDRELSIPRFNDKWPNGKWLDGLVELAEGLFQWAYTACRFIEGDGKAGHDPVKRLADLLSENSGKSHPLNKLDKLYMAILRQTLPTDNPDYAKMFKSVMACVLTARQPLSMDVLKRFILQDDDNAFTHPVDLVLPPLGALLSGVAETSSPVLPLHSSFRDFLLNDKRSAECYVDISTEHDHLSVACLNVMQECLRFNICDLQTSHLANVDVPDLSSRIQHAIPRHLSYACLFWTDHLLASSPTPAILSQLKSFMQTHFLHWLEAMSLMAVIPTANTALLKLRDKSEVRCQEFYSSHALILSTAVDGY